MPVNLERWKICSEMQTGVGRWDDFNLADVTAWTERWANDFGVPKENVSFEVRMESYPYDDAEYAAIYAKGWRYEDDATYEARIIKEREDMERARKAGRAAAAKAKLKKEADELAEYERLKRKFGDEQP